jgi:hypothetical protein
MVLDIVARHGMLLGVVYNLSRLFDDCAEFGLYKGRGLELDLLILYI